MKKIRFACLSMLTMMTLTGCGGAKASFKEVKYEKLLTNAETTLVLAQVKANLIANLSEYSSKQVTDAKSDVKDNHNELTVTTTLYSGGYAHLEGKTLVENKSDGLIRKQETKIVQDIFRLNDEKIANYGVVDETVVCSIQAGQENQVYENAINSVLNLFNGLQGVKDSKENIKFVSSDLEENYVPVLYGNDTKVVHTLTKEQTVVEIDKNNKIKSYYSYSSTETNQDPDTGEIKSKDVKTNETKTSATFTYKSRKDKSGNYASIKDTILNTYNFSGNPALTAKYGEDNVNIDSLVSSKRIGYAKYEYTAMVSFDVGAAPLNENGKTFKFILDGKIKKLNDNETENLSKDITAVDFSGKVDFTVVQEVELVVKYTVELTSDKTVANISDVSVFIA